MTKRNPNKFLKKTRETLAKRAGQTCSNPYCKIPTTGPHTDNENNIDIGEAAHIRGAMPGSKRYEPNMEPEERSNIFNAIWLCRKCAKLIDSDEKRFSVDLLYEWKRNHERKIANEIIGNNWESKLDYQRLSPFENESAAAYQIVLDQGENWKFFLTIELIRSKLSVISEEYEELHQGLIYRRSKFLADSEEVRIWLREKFTDFEALVELLNISINTNLNDAWGRNNGDGDTIAVLKTSNLIEKGCRGLLDWEIDLCFTFFPDDFGEIKELMRGCTIASFEEMEKIPKELTKQLTELPKIPEIIRLDLYVGQPSNFDEVVQIWNRNS